MSSMSAHERDLLPSPKVDEVSAGVFGYVQADGSWGLNNTGFIVGRDSVLAIDACFTQRRTLALLDAIRRQSGAKPARTLINTHHHGDHTFGNCLFLPDAVIVGQERCREAIIAEGTAAQRLFPGVEWGEITAAPPSVTFTDRLDVWVDDLKVELICVAPAHTTNDIVAWIPGRRVLFSGDVIFNHGTPFALAGSLEGWLEAIDRLRMLDVETIVPGHGALCGPEVFDDIEEYVRFVLDAARTGLASRAEPLEVAREMDLGRFGEWTDTERLAANLHRAYSELRGEPRAAPLPANAVQDMIAFNGGEMPRCLA